MAIRFFQSAIGLLFAVSFFSHAAAESGDNPVVVELFTSQGCYSCPPAEAYLGELAQDPNILALEWHVDYWDSLVYGSAGRWKDPFSDPAFTARQSDYNRVIRGTNRIYTPQMVIDGADEAVGSRRKAVSAAIQSASKRPKPVKVLITPSGTNGYSVQVDGTAEQNSSLWLIHFVRSRTTEVLRGENHGKKLTSHNIVRHVEKLADWNGEPATFSFDAPPDGLGCAILVQRASGSPVIGAQHCGAAPGA